MNTQNIELNFTHLIACFNEYKLNPESALLKDRLKKHLIGTYDAIDYVSNDTPDMDDTKVEKQSMTMKFNENTTVIQEAPVVSETLPEVEVMAEVKEEFIKEVESVEEEEVVETGFEANTFIETNKGHDFDLFSEFLSDGDKESEMHVKEVENNSNLNSEVENEVYAIQDHGLLEEEGLYMESPSDSLEEEEVSFVEKVRVPQTDVMEEYKNKSIASLATTIPIGKKFEFIEDLFIGNSEEYSNAIREIDAMSDFHKAEEFLMQNYFDKFGWMEKEKVLNNLFDFVTRRFAA